MPINRYYIYVSLLDTGQWTLILDRHFLYAQMGWVVRWMETIKQTMIELL